MATMLKSTGIIIRKGQEKEFFSMLRKNQPTQEFWNDCKNIRKNINDKSMTELNELMDRKE